MSLTDNQSSPLYLTLRRPKRYKWTDNQNSVSSYQYETNQPLTPDVLQPSNPLVHTGDDAFTPTVRKIGNYLLLQQIDVTSPSVSLYKAINMQTQQKCLCKVVPVARYHDVLEPFLRVGYHENINSIEEVILGKSEAYFFFMDHHGDLHTYVRNARRLKEPEAAVLFHQIASAVQHCHENGIVVRDLKLRKFVFKNPERTQLMLEGFEDSIILSPTDDDEESDSLTDKHGCPVYVSPEILQNTTHYSGRLADVWSLGVILYTMLVGCYPFHDTNIGVLFTLIRHGNYNIPPTISASVKGLIRNILRMKPAERLKVNDILIHPWFEQCKKATSERSWRSETREQDHQVPDVDVGLSTSDSLYRYI